MGDLETAGTFANISAQILHQIIDRGKREDRRSLASAADVTVSCRYSFLDSLSFVSCFCFTRNLSPDGG